MVVESFRIGSDYPRTDVSSAHDDESTGAPDLDTGTKRRLGRTRMRRIRMRTRVRSDRQTAGRVRPGSQRACSAQARRPRVEPGRAAPRAGDRRHGRRVPAAPRRVHRLHHRVADPRRRRPRLDTPGSAWPGLVAVAGFVVGAVAGGWLARLELGRHRRVAFLLLVDAAFIAAGAVVAATVGIGTHDGKYVVIALLAIAMGCQTAAIRLVHVPEIPIAAATLATFGVVVGLTGEHGDRTSLLRRAGVVVAILVGASSARRWRAGNRGSRGRRRPCWSPAWLGSRTGGSRRPDAPLTRRSSSSGRWPWPAARCCTSGTSPSAHLPSPAWPPCDAEPSPRA